ncbi:hypothetical protein [Serratia proteamaculans]|uniref:hypothetical protein n=1 Tax=Serratia proteamaculans TaxID=28151 RepID=UPI001020FBEF|nr:hypothetical protein [Serratia proteamaculans]RYM54801.1 hypothetical protein BSQ97_01775 [Serratia proteamaculans]CAI1614278.1 Uncharacterised protein [Serratia proteamaculans]
MNSKILSAFKYTMVFMAGFIANFSGVLRSVSDIPNSYEEFKKTYLYDESFLGGKWSTNSEYLINGADVGLDPDQPDVVMELVNGNSGQVSGEIISKNICDAMPLTWVISIESASPNLLNFFVDRSFFVKQLHGGSMETVAELKLVEENRDHGVIKFKRVSDDKSAFPEFIVFGKDLPDYKKDMKGLSDYCSESSSRFLKQHRSNK